MLRQCLVGGATSLVNIAIHAMIMTSVIHVAQNAKVKNRRRRPLFLMTVMIPTVSVFMLTHTLEVAVWAVTYWMTEAAPASADLLYFAFVNYTTLGYGDVTPIERWALLGPMTAMNGVLLFGWSTAVIFEVLRRTLRLSEGIAEEKR